MSRVANFTMLFVGVLMCVSIIGCDGGPGGDPNTNTNTNNNGANTNENADNGNDNSGGGTVALNDVVDTGVRAHPEGYLAAAAGLIAFQTDDGDTGAPAVYDIAGERSIDITAADDTELAGDFAIGGSTVILRNSTNDGVYAFDALDPDTAASRVGSSVRLDDLANGFMNSDGGNIVAFITSEPFICWIDVSQAPLSIETFAVLPQGVAFSHVAVSGTQIAFFDGDSRIEVRDTATGGRVGAFTVSANTEYPLAFRDGVLAFVDSGSGALTTIDVASEEQSATAVIAAGAASGDARGSQALSVGGGTLCAFSNEDSFGSSRPSVVGAVGGTLSAAPNAATGFRTSPGWGTTCAVSPGGALAFIAGDGAPSNAQSDILSVRQGDTIIDDFEGNFTASISFDPMVVTASDIVIAPGVAAFKLFIGEAGAASLGYLTFSE